jgi:hypothetical protein
MVEVWLELNKRAQILSDLSHSSTQIQVEYFAPESNYIHYV